jgi:hypothetical protein
VRLNLSSGGSKVSISACRGSAPGRRSTICLPDRLLAGALLPPQSREQTGEDDRRLAAAGAADQGDEVLLAQLIEEGGDRVLAAEEEAGILLAERQQTAIRADGLADDATVGGRSTTDAGEQQLELRGVGEVGAEVDPGLELEEAAGRVLDLGQEDGDDGEGAALALCLCLVVEGKLDLALLPSAKTRGADKDGDGAAARDASLEGRKPRLAGEELVAVEEGGEAGLLQACLDLAHRFRVGAAVAQESVERVTVHRPADPPRASGTRGSRLLLVRQR